jgi:gamma-glutamylcysteine synthetase
MARITVTVDPRRVEVELEQVEATLLTTLCAQVADLVAPADDVDPLVALVGLDPAATVPEDDALRRLFPDAYGDDAEAAARFRRFTERGLRERKVADAGTVLRALTAADEEVDEEADEPRRLMLADEQVDAWLGLLNDARLTLGTRLAVTQDNHDELATLPPQDPRAGMYALYEWLTFLQDATVGGLLGDG